uniref:Uncharacterized protein n=1 Tax=Caenorhabditis japonica TaxID=281687 RepID=A0A8R1DZS8_CAEJA
MVTNCSLLFVLLAVALTTAQLNDHFDTAQVYWPSELKRSPSGSDGELFALPGLRGLRGKRVPMMSLKGLRGKRAHFQDNFDLEQ